MTLRLFMSYILVNILRILKNLFKTLITFFQKTSVIAMATLTQLDTFLLNLLKSYWRTREPQSQIHPKTHCSLSFKPISFDRS